MLIIFASANDKICLFFRDIVAKKLKIKIQKRV